MLDMFVFIFKHMWEALSGQLDQLLLFRFFFATAASQHIVITVMAEGGKLFSCSATKTFV